MLSIADIHDAVEDLLGERFPGEPVHHDLVPQNFERPAFLVEGGPVKMAEAGSMTLDVTATVRITAFAAVDEYHNSQVAELRTRMMAILELFAVGYLEVDGRALHVAGNEGEYGFDFATVTVTLSYRDDRPGEDEVYQTMGEVHTTIKKE